MDLDLLHVNDINEGLRNLCMGRVSLKSDYVADATSIQLGLTHPDSGLSIPGTCLFRHKVTTARVVQPTAANIPGAAGIEHSEMVTINGSLVGDPIDLPITAALTNEYTTALGAYVELPTLPTVCSGLQQIVEDFTELAAETPEDHWFPGVFVTWELTQYGAWTIVAWRENAPFIVRYMMLQVAGQNNRNVLLARVSELVNLISEDNYLGGTVEESNVTAVVPCWNSEQRLRSVDRLFVTASGVGFLWADIVVHTFRTGVWDKRSVS